MAVTDTTESGQTPPSEPTNPFTLVRTAAWWHRHLDPEERRRVMDELAMNRAEHWVWRFTIMLTLSVVVAVMGLSAGSAAVVIGAMLLAPLMQPVLATAACLSMSLLRQSIVSLFKVIAATVWCIGIAFVLSMITPDGELSSEVLSRTRPDIRDLVVALAAGMAGAYATVRKDASSSLPGVAVAVALVPPLATVGITLQEGERSLAVGALLLYVTNLAAIVFAGVMVFIATGFVPPRRLSNTAIQLVVAAIIAFTLVAAIAVPLFNRSAAAVEAAEEAVVARNVVGDWVGEADLGYDVDIDGDRVFVRLTGFGDPPDEGSLREDLRAALGEDINVNVEFIRTYRATTTTTAPPTDDEALLTRVSPVVDGWLGESGNGFDYEREPLRLVDGVVIIDLAGTGQPPPVDTLLDRLAAAGEVVQVRVNWTERQLIEPEPEASPVELVEAELLPIVDDWADANDVVVVESGFDGERVHIEVIGSTAPPIDALIADLRDVTGLIDGRPARIDVFFTPQQRLTTTVIPELFGGTVPGEAPAADGADQPASSQPSATTTTTVGG